MRKQTQRSSQFSPFPSPETIREVFLEKFDQSLEGWYVFYGIGREDRIPYQFKKIYKKEQREECFWNVFVDIDVVRRYFYLGAMSENKQLLSKKFPKCLFPFLNIINQQQCLLRPSVLGITLKLSSTCM